MKIHPTMCKEARPPRLEIQAHGMISSPTGVHDSLVC